MKKISIFLIPLFFAFITFSVFAATKDFKDWYQFSSNSQTHNFSLLFPKDWQIKYLDDKTELLIPQNAASNKNGFIVREFSNQSYNMVINYFASDGLTITEIKDVFVAGKDEDLLGKQATYKNKNSNNLSVITLFKRGHTVITISNPNNQFADIYNDIVNSLKFNDKWKTYINSKYQFSFIYHKDFVINETDNELNVKPSSSTDTIFTISKIGKPQITFLNQQAYQTDSLEMIDSFAFFDLDLTNKLHNYQNFFDVPDQHPNAKAINSLYDDGILKGYDDGSFKPNGEVTRAELLKMIVSALSSPSINDFNNCFPDVKNDWFAPYVCYAKKYNWVDGFKDGKFHPNDKVTRVEAIKIIINGFFNGKIGNEVLKDNSVDDIHLNEWYGKYFIFADNRDLLDKQHVIEKGSQSLYLPLKNITRKEVAETIYRIKNLPR